MLNREKVGKNYGNTGDFWRGIRTILEDPKVFLTVFCSFFFFYFATIHSVLFPGGASDLYDSPYERTGKILFNLSVKANKAGDVFPLWGTCLGFEFLSICGAGGGHIISNVDGENYSVALNLSVGK